MVIIPARKLAGRLASVEISSAPMSPPSAPKAIESGFAHLRRQNNPKYLEWLHLRNLLEIADDDSIALEIDLTDSTVCLRIQGMPARVCTLRAYELSPPLRLLADRADCAGWLAEPFRMESFWGSIAKVPRFVRTAPKDTIEAQKNAKEPKALDEQGVEFRLTFDRGLVIHVRESELRAPGANRHAWRTRLRTIGRTIAQSAALAFKRSAVSPFEITIEVPRSDARAVYRAIPADTRLALRL